MATGWIGSRQFTPDPGFSRAAAPIGAPDLVPFPGWLGARSVLFFAGLELGLLHHGLAALARLRRTGWLPDLARFAGPLHRIAAMLEPFGSDRGSMIVSVLGRDAEERPRGRDWVMIAEAGDGPTVPAIAAALLTRRLGTGSLDPGARLALAEFTLAAAEAELARLHTTCRRREAAAPRLFEAALGPRWHGLPAPIRAMRDLWDLHSASGTATVTRGTSPLARLVSSAFLPPAAASRSASPCRQTARASAGLATSPAAASPRT